jgi:hypothetical protein
MYGGQCSGYYVQSLIQLREAAAMRRLPFSFSFAFNESLIQRARNSLAHQFLKTDHSHLLFIDGDMLFGAADVLRMVDADKDVICAVCPKKEINWAAVAEAARAGVPAQDLRRHAGALVVKFLDGQPPVEAPLDQPLEIAAGGTGIMLIRREVLEGIVSAPWYANNTADLGGQIAAGERLREYFPVFVDPASGQLLSEDYGFCKLARDHGYRVWAAPWVKAGHYGTYLFEGAPGA